MVQTTEAALTYQSAHYSSRKQMGAQQIQLMELRLICKHIIVLAEQVTALLEKNAGQTYQAGHMS